MKIIDAIKKLERESVILEHIKTGDLFQKYNENLLMQTYKERKGNSIGSTIKNEDFLRQYIDDEFIEVEQWFYKDIKLPILCKVKESFWADYKIVSFKYISDVWFHTGLSESYTPSYRCKIIPLTDKEIEDLKRGYS